MSTGLGAGSAIHAAEFGGPYVSRPFLGGVVLPEPDAVPHPGQILGRPLDVPEETPVRPGVMVCKRCDVGTKEVRCWNCGDPVHDTRPPW